jgi:glycerophosphoryl diester phosphodiesterase
VGTFPLISAGPDNPWLGRRVLNYAHQGGSHEMPSSTLAALRAACAVGAQGIELDVHCTADRVLVVCHDATLDRTCDVAGAIATMTWEQLQAVDNSYWFLPDVGVLEDVPESDRAAVRADVSRFVNRGKAPADASFGVARLDDVLDEFRDVYLNLDIKQTAPDVEPYEALLGEMLVAHGRTDDVIVASFHDHATAAFRELGHLVATSAGTLATIAFWQAVSTGATELPEVLSQCVALQVPYRLGDNVVLTQQFVDRAHETGLAVHVWTINDQPDMQAVLALGVDAIITDRPTLLRDTLASD